MLASPAAAISRRVVGTSTSPSAVNAPITMPCAPAATAARTSRSMASTSNGE